VNRSRKFIAGGAVIAAALGYMIYAGVTQSAVYFVTPAELRSAAVPGKAYRLGGNRDDARTQYELAQKMDPASATGWPAAWSGEPSSAASPSVSKASGS